ncbi:MAG: S4 domain-containing protein YaaA [Erysipelotrichaceae bacterium]|nr:S4 domain-containing protein YaaA [Erysipelotrichaceae bacterium]
MATIVKVEIKDEYVTLGQFLKLADIISSGGEAKLFLKGNEVLVNDEKDDRRGRKLYKGDLIKTAGKVYEICR